MKVEDVKTGTKVKISDEENYLLPDGTKIENPAITAMLAGEKEIMNIVEKKEEEN